MTKSWLRDKRAKYSHGKITHHTDMLWSETEKHKLLHMNENYSKKKKTTILTMRNYVGGQAIFSIQCRVQVIQPHSHSD